MMDLQVYMLMQIAAMVTGAAAGFAIFLLLERVYFWMRARRRKRV